MSETRRSIDAQLLDRLTRIETQLELWIKAVSERNADDQATTKDHEDRLRTLESANYRYVQVIGAFAVLFAVFKERIIKIFE